MITVHKYPLTLVDLQDVSLPEEAKLLCVQVQKEQVCLWALVEVGRPLAMRRIRIAGTGHPISENGLKYISTFQIYDGALVFHVFEVDGDTK